MKPTFLQVRIDPKLKTRFKRLAEKRGHDMSQITIQLLESWCNKMESRIALRGEKK